MPSSSTGEVCKGKPANQSRQGKCHRGGVLGHPGLTQMCSKALLALLGSPGLSWAAPSCSWSPPALPPESPREQPNHDNQHGPTSLGPGAPQRIFQATWCVPSDASNLVFQPTSLDFQFEWLNLELCSIYHRKGPDLRWPPSWLILPCVRIT